MPVNRYYNGIRRFCAVLIGCVFMLGGSFKLMDPTGASLVIQEYWNFFHLGFMRWSSMPTGILLALLETFCGMALISGIFRRTSAILTMALCTFFTILTAILAIFNPAMDCGCFGEVIHLTHMQTLLKNIVLDVLCLIAFLPLRDFGKPKKRKYFFFATGAIASTAMLIYSLANIPVKDYTDLKAGTILQAAISQAYEETSENEMFEIRFIYEKDGKEQSFSLEDELPDSSWTFVRSENIQKNQAEGQTVEAHLGIRDTESGAYHDSLAVQGDVLIISGYKARKGKQNKALSEESIALLEDASAMGIRPLYLCTENAAVDSNHGAEYFTYYSDRRSLMSLNRSDGGATLVRDGVIVKKWPQRRLPEVTELAELTEGESLETIADDQAKAGLIQNLYLLVLFILLIL